MDENKIISKSNSTTQSTLHLQEGSNGHVEIGNHYTSDTWDATNDRDGPVPSGGIIMWTGPETSVPNGWHVCDGTANPGGTTIPDLRNKFVVGVGANSVGYENGSDNITLTTSNLPNHSHTLQVMGRMTMILQIVFILRMIIKVLVLMEAFHMKVHLVVKIFMVLKVTMETTMILYYRR